MEIYRALYIFRVWNCKKEKKSRRKKGEKRKIEAGLEVVGRRGLIQRRGFKKEEKMGKRKKNTFFPISQDAVKTHFS